MAKFSLPALDFTIQSPIKIKKKKLEAFKDPAVAKGFTGTHVEPPMPPITETDIEICIAETEAIENFVESTTLENPTFIRPVREAGTDEFKGTVEGNYSRQRKAILNEQLRTLGHVKHFTVKEVIPALVQLFEKKNNRSFRKMELMAIENYVHGISHTTLGKALNLGPFEPNRIQMKNGSWRAQRNNAKWRIEMSHWNGKERRYECNADTCIKCEAIIEFYNAE
jgi:hypothetical protein